ncbi:MAG: hypothetical protein ACYC99_12000 [Candidatus Geothermincolia bacterium]
MSQLVMTFDGDVLIWLRRIIIDEDKDEAMEFVWKVLEPKVKEAERSSGMKRAFDVGGADGQVGGRR